MPIIFILIGINIFGCSFSISAQRTDTLSGSLEEVTITAYKDEPVRLSPIMIPSISLDRVGDVVFLWKIEVSPLPA